MATTYRPGQIAEILGVSVDTVRRWCDDGRLTMSRSEGGHRVVDGGDLARYLIEHSDSLEAESAVQMSARNRLTGIVTAVKRDKLVAVVEMQAGPFRLVSLMTREAADDLLIEPGDLAVAVVKSTNVVVEVPPR
jgi:molybdopterin-binding protein